MTRKELDIGYELIADEGKELIVVINGEELGRAKTVIVPGEETLNEWVEVPEKKVETVVDEEEEEKAKRIAELEAELEELKK